MSNEHFGLARGRGRGRGRGNVKKTLNIVKAMSMPALDKLSLGSNFEVPFCKSSIGNSDDDFKQDEQEDPCSRRQCVKSSIFLKSLNSITTDQKRRADSLNRTGSRSHSCLFDTREQFKDCEDQKELPMNKTFTIEPDSNNNNNNNNTNNTIVKKKKKPKEREWDRGKIYNKESGMWVPDDLQTRTETSSRRNNKIKYNYFNLDRLIEEDEEKENETFEF